MLSLFFTRKKRRIAALLLLPLLVSAVITGKSSSAKAVEKTVTVSTAPGMVPLSEASSPPDVSAKSAVLINAETGEVYFEKNADARLPMASTTKIMTALVAIEALPLDTVIRVPREAVGVEGSSIYLYEGECLSLEALLYALLLESANDAAVAIACGVAGSVAAFAERMNTRAAALGLKDTHFTNPHGLDNDAHYTTARELATVTAEAMRSECFRTIVSTYKRSIPREEEDGVRLFVNHNRLLRTYDGCVGVKTGYTKRSGRCLVSAAERDGLTLIAVTLSDPDDWRDHASLFDYGFSLYASVPLTESGRLSFTLPVLNGVHPTATVSYETADGLPLRVTLPREHAPISMRVELPPHLWGSYTKGQVIGKAIFLCGDTVLCEVPLALDAPVEEISYRFRPLWRLREFLKKSGA